MPSWSSTHFSKPVQHPTTITKNALLAVRKSADRLNTMATRKVRISLTLSSDILKEVDRQAVIAKVSRSAFIEGVLRQYLRDQTRGQSPGTHHADWLGSMEGTMKILGDIVSPIDDKDGREPKERPERGGNTSSSGPS